MPASPGLSAIDPRESSDRRMHRVSIKVSEEVVELLDEKAALEALRELKDTMKETFEGYLDQGQVLPRANVAKFLQDVAETVAQDGQEPLPGRWQELQVRLEQRLPITGFTFAQFMEAVEEAVRALAGRKPTDSPAPVKHNSSLFFAEGLFDDKMTVEVPPIWSGAQAPQAAQDWLAKNPGFQWRGEWRKQGSQSFLEVYRAPPPVDFARISEDQRAMLAELSGYLAGAKADIQQYLRAPAAAAGDVCKAVVDLLPVKMKKVQYLN